MISYNKVTSKAIFFYSFFTAFFCAIKTINVYLTRDLDPENAGGSLMAMMYIISIIGQILVSLIYGISYIKKIPLDACFILFWILLFYFFTSFFIGKPYTNLPFFLVFTVLSFIIPFSVQIDGRLFVRFVMFFSLPAIFHLKQVFAPINDYTDYISMGISYSFLTPIVASMVYMFCYFQNERNLQKVFGLMGVLLNLVFATYLLTLGSRGPVFAMIATFLFLYAYKPNVNSLGIKQSLSKSFSIIVVLVICMFAFVTILTELRFLFANFDLSFRFINKFLTMSQEGDITNGREMIYDVVISDIIESPIWGYGCDQLGNRHMEFVYPHNFFLQILYDGGIILFLVLVIPLFKGIKRIWRTCTLNEYAVYTVLFFSSVPGALFSGDLWGNSFLWLLFGALLSKTFVNKDAIVQY